MVQSRLLTAPDLTDSESLLPPTQLPHFALVLKGNNNEKPDIQQNAPTCFEMEGCCLMCATASDSQVW